MDHLFLYCLSFIFFGIWNIKPEWRIASFLSFMSLFGSIILIYGSENSLASSIWHTGLDLIIFSIHLFVFQFIKHLKWSIFILFPLGLSLYYTHGIAQSKFATQTYEDHPEVLIKFHDLQYANDFVNDYAHSIESFELAFDPKYNSRTDLDDYYVLDLYENIDPTKFVHSLKGNNKIEWVEENQRVDLPDLKELTTVDDKLNSNFNDPFSKGQWHIEAFQLSQMHDKLSESKLKPKKKVLIAILDTGIDSKHEDLSKIYKSSGDKKSDTDPKGHGTHCAGIAAAISNNKKGIASILPKDSPIEIMSIQVLNNFGFGTQQTIISGIIKAVDLNADVISLSLGGMTSEQKEKAYKEAVQYANKHGSIVVVAAGNSSKNAKNYSPANTKGVIAVAAVDEKLSLAPFSNNVDELEMGIAAPGVNILSTFPKNQYKQFNGTSMAAPFVAGMIAILKMYHPNITTKEVYTKLNTGAVSAQNSSTPIIQPIQVVDGL